MGLTGPVLRYRREMYAVHPRTATAFQQALDLPARTLRASPARPIAGREWRTRLLPGVHAYYTSAGQRRFVMVRRLKYTEADT